MLVDENEARASLLEKALDDAGCEIVAKLVGRPDLRSSVTRTEPDVIIIAMESPDRDTLEDMSQISREQPRPTVMFVDRSDTESTRAAVAAGVSAYVVGGLARERVRAILDVAIARFNEFQALKQEVAVARESLAERRVIERAKGILMQHRGLSEDDAYRTLRKMAMDRKMRLGRIAREVVAAAELLR
jgi:response regulator NasT